MKRRLLSLLFYFILVFAFSSCSSSYKAALAERRSDLLHAKDAGQGCFVQYKDGSMRQFHELVLVTGMLKLPYLLADDSIKIYPVEIQAYQNKDHYAVSQDLFSGGRRTYLAVETLPGFAVRTSKGVLNVFCKKYYNGRNAVDEFYLQGSDGKIQPYSCELMNELLKNDPMAMHYFNGNQETSINEKIHATAALHNLSAFATK